MSDTTYIEYLQGLDLDSLYNLLTGPQGPNHGLVVNEYLARMADTVEDITRNISPVSKTRKSNGEISDEEEINKIYADIDELDKELQEVLLITDNAELKKRASSIATQAPRRMKTLVAKMRKNQGRHTSAVVRKKQREKEHLEKMKETVAKEKTRRKKRKSPKGKGKQKEYTRGFVPVPEDDDF